MEQVSTDSPKKKKKHTSHYMLCSAGEWDGQVAAPPRHAFAIFPSDYILFNVMPLLPSQKKEKEKGNASSITCFLKFIIFVATMIF